MQIIQAMRCNASIITDQCTFTPFHPLHNGDSGRGEENSSLRPAKQVPFSKYVLTDEVRRPDHLFDYMHRAEKITDIERTLKVYSVRGH